MPEETDPRGELGAGELEVADRLRRGRPVADGGFRGALARRLHALDPGWGPRPPHLTAHLGAYSAAGLFLILAGALTGLGVL